MPKSRVRITSCFLWVALTILGFQSSSPAKANNFIITEPTDVWFDYSEPTLFIAQTYMVDGLNSDPQLWLYDEQGILLISNDDYNGLQSYISIEVQPGKYRLRAGTCCWEPDVWRSGGGWNLQYELAFEGAESQQTTTTLQELTPTTQESTTTTEEPTTTSTSTTTTVPPTTTTQLPPTTSTTSTSTSSTSTTTSTSTTIVATTTTEIPVVPETSVPPTTSTSSSSTTTTSTSPVTTTTLALVTTTLPPLPQPTTTLEIPLTTTIAPEPTPAQGISQEVSSLLNAVAMLPQAEVQAAVENIIQEGVSAEEATALATNPAVLEAVNATQATEIFDAVVVSELSDTQAEQLVEAVQDAPEEVRAAFEEEINIFGSKFNKYVPIGSNINVGQRKVLIAATGVLFIAPTVSVSSSSSGSESNSRQRRT